MLLDLDLKSIKPYVNVYFVTHTLSSWVWTSPAHVQSEDLATAFMSTIWPGFPLRSCSECSRHIIWTCSFLWLLVEYSIYESLLFLPLFILCYKWYLLTSLPTVLIKNDIRCATLQHTTQLRIAKYGIRRIIQYVNNTTIPQSSSRIAGTESCPLG